MTSRKGKGKTTPKGDFSFRFETRATRKRSPAIRIESRSEKDNAQTSSPGRRDENVPYKKDNQDYLGHLWITHEVRCPRTRYPRLTLTSQENI